MVLYRNGIGWFVLDGDFVWVIVKCSNVVGDLFKIYVLVKMVKVGRVVLEDFFVGYEVKGVYMIVDSNKYVGFVGGYGIGDKWVFVIYGVLFKLYEMLVKCFEFFYFMVFCLFWNYYCRFKIGLVIYCWFWC